MGLFLLVLSSTAIAVYTATLGSATLADARLGSLLGVGTVFVVLILVLVRGGTEGARASFRSLRRGVWSVALLGVGFCFFQLVMPQSAAAGAGIIAIASVATATLAIASAFVTRKAVWIKLLTAALAMALAFATAPAVGVVWAIAANAPYQAALVWGLARFEKANVDPFLGLSVAFVVGGGLIALTAWPEGGDVKTAGLLGLMGVVIPLLLPAVAARLLSPGGMAAGLGLNLAVQAGYAVFVSRAWPDPVTGAAVISITVLLLATTYLERPRSR